MNWGKVTALALAGIVGLSGWAFASPAASQEAGSVYLLRGGWGIFSTGLNELGEKLQAAGIPAKVEQYGNWREYVADIVKRIEAGEEALPVVIMGHSFGANAALLIAGIAGTTMGGVIYVVRSILVKEKGWTAKDLKIEQRDALISALVMFLLSLAIMACAAGTLHPRGLRVDNAIDMVRLLEPLAGRFAISIFVAGIVCAGLSSLFPIAILAPWLLADYTNTERDLRSGRSRVIVLFVISLGLVVPIFGGRPVLVMIASQALITLATPLIILLMLLLQNKKSVMGAYTPSRAMNVAMGLIFVFSILMAITGIVGLVNLF
ncbi:MAG: divalent metal cation transporter [Bacteroidetes bacterium]|nr:divalent metal cation transporter [Bacteroidota bacterium]